MKATFNIAVVIVLALIVAAVVIAKSQPRAPASSVSAGPEASASPTTQAAPLPKLVDLGAGKCIPCKMMAPILDELRGTYTGRFDIQFIDVWENRSAGEAYRIRVIPTQIFFNAEGKELFRHEGFFSREDILSTWKRLGHEFPALSPTAATKG